MQWETETTKKPQVRHNIHAGPVFLDVQEDDERGEVRQWQYMTLTVSEFSTEPHESCLKSWPREALALARKALDELEASLAPDVSDDVEDARRMIYETNHQDMPFES